MSSVTLHCHPAAFYYWLDEKIIGNVAGLHYLDWEINKENEPAITSNLAGLLARRYRDGGAGEQDRDDYFQRIVLHSEDDELLVWVSLTAPTKATLPRSD